MRGQQADNIRRAKPLTLLLAGSGLAGFLLYAFFFAPEHLPQFKIYLLAIASALFAGLFASLFIGSIGLKKRLMQIGRWEVTFEATGGYALAVLVLFWFLGPFTPIEKNEDIFLQNARGVDGNVIQESFSKGKSIYQSAEDIRGPVVQRAIQGDRHVSGAEGIEGEVARLNHDLRRMRAQKHATQNRLSRLEKTSKSFESYTDREQVMAAQEVLKKLGYYTGAVDGIAGRKTQMALLQFQRDVGLEETGTGFAGRS
jgi:hypothetical protein